MAAAAHAELCVCRKEERKAGNKREKTGGKGKKRGNEGKRRGIRVESEQVAGAEREFVPRPSRTPSSVPPPPLAEAAAPRPRVRQSRLLSESR
eukprot:3935777-Rhodomonas_salina.5